MTFDPNGLRPNGFDPEAANRLIKDALSTLPAEYRETMERTENELIIEKMKDLTREVNKDWRQFCQQCGIVRPQDNIQGARQWLCGRYLDGLHKWDKDELVIMLTILSTEMAVERYQ